MVLLCPAVPALGGRTALEAYTEVMAAFRDEFSQLLGTVVTDADIGLGPKGEFRYPSTPLDSRWNFPGIGEFQVRAVLTIGALPSPSSSCCYSCLNASLSVSRPAVSATGVGTSKLVLIMHCRAVCMQCYDCFMVASLSAAAQQVGQPHWGNSGPHDAGSYCQWPHQTGFFHHQGSWDSEYGRFFLQWYSQMLLMHADQLLGRAKQVLGERGVKLHARLPTLHWWYNQAAHAVS